MRKPHIHADNMKRYAEDAMACDTPWERWEWKDEGDPRWHPLTGHPAWDPEREYRRRPETMLVNRHKVPVPYRDAPRQDAAYYIPTPHREEMAVARRWAGTDTDRHILRERLAHATREGAIAHAKALLDWQIN